MRIRRRLTVLLLSSAAATGSALIVVLLLILNGMARQTRAAYLREFIELGIEGFQRSAELIFTAMAHSDDDPAALVRRWQFESGGRCQLLLFDHTGDLLEPPEVANEFRQLLPPAQIEAAVFSYRLHGTDTVHLHDFDGGLPVLIQLRVFPQRVVAFAQVLHTDAIRMAFLEEQDRRSLLLFALIGLGVISLVLLSIGIALDRGLRKALILPLERFSHTVDTFAREGHSRAIAIDGPEEIRVLQQVFQDMANRVLAQHEVLERTVAERTADLLEAKQQAESANRAKSAFLSSMSHEIRTPLNAVLGYAQQLARDPRLDHQQRRMIQVINRSGEHLLALLNDLLDMSRIESGRTVADLGPLDLPDLLMDIRDLFWQRAQDTGVALLLEGVETVPTTIESDIRKLRQILFNLVANAIKFTEQGQVCIQASYAEGQLTVAVSDTGPGIPAADIQRLFQPFEQLHAADRHGGSGLGLALSQGFAQVLGGRISVHSTWGEGSCFTLQIPVTVMDAPYPASEPRSSLAEQDLDVDLRARCDLADGTRQHLRESLELGDVNRAREQIAACTDSAVRRHLNGLLDAYRFEDIRRFLDESC